MHSLLADDKYEFTEAYNTWNKEEMEHWTGPYYGFQNVKLILGHGEAPCGYNRGHYGRWLKKNHPEALKLVIPREDADTMSSSDRGDIYLSHLPSELHHSMWLADEACQEIENSVSKEEPLFMFVGFPDPHHPFTPPEDAAQGFLDLECPDFAVKDERIKEKPQRIQETIHKNHAVHSDIEKAYKYTEASVSLIDKAVGRIVSALKEQNLYDDTIIIFTSDHGDFLGDFEMLAKDNVPMKSLVHVPFVMKALKSMDLSEYKDRAMSNADVLPTLFRILDLEIPEGIQGVDITSHSAKANIPLVSCYGHHDSGKSITIFDEKTRYSYYPVTGEEEYYDHETDPKEEQNLAWHADDKMRKVLDNKKIQALEKHARSETGLYNLYALW